MVAEAHASHRRDLVPLRSVAAAVVWQTDAPAASLRDDLPHA